MKISKIRETLKEIISGQVLWDEEILRYYSVDASSYQIIPKIVVIPKNESDVISLVKFAKKIKMSVTARGAGTGLVGSALNDGIIIDLKNLNAVKIGKNSATVGSGVLKGMLDKKLEEKRKFFPPNPSVGTFCSVGGMLANNSSGSRSLKYGSTIDNVTQITFVDGNGKKITLPKDHHVGSKILRVAKNINQKKYPLVTKNSSGYRLDTVKTINHAHKAIIGSEGTLGIILKAKLKIADIPDKRFLCVIEYDSLNDAAKNCTDVLSTLPSAIEFVDRPTLKQIPQKFSKDAKCLLFVEYDSEIIKRKNQLKKIVLGKIIKQASKETEIKKWWRYRDSALYYSLKTIKKKKRVPHVIEDATVPAEKLGELFSLIKKTNQKFHTKSIMYGHAGNANIHVRLISDRLDVKKIKTIAEYYVSHVISLGGTMTGEHGDGLARSEFLKSQYGQKNYLVFRKLKTEMDPAGILNPGKIFAKKGTIIKNLESFEKN